MPFEKATAENSHPEPTFSEFHGASQGTENSCIPGHDGIKSGRGFYDYGAEWSEGKLEEAVRNRDREFLQRLKNLYWSKVAGK